MENYDCGLLQPLYGTHGGAPPSPDMFGVTIQKIWSKMRSSHMICNVLNTVPGNCRKRSSCSHEIFTDQSYHAWIRSEKNPSIRSDACMTADYARGQPASAWPLAGQPCKVDCDLHTIARAHNRSNGCSPIGTLGPRVAAVV